MGSSTADQVLKYTKYPKHLPSTSTGQVLIFLKRYLSTSSTFISSTSTITSTHITIGFKVGMDIQNRVNFGWTKQKGIPQIKSWLKSQFRWPYSMQSRFWMDKIKGLFPNHVSAQKSGWPYSMQTKFGMDKIQGSYKLDRVANSHAYGVILTHLTCYSRTHAIDKFNHAFKRNHTHTHAFYKIENNLLCLIIVTFIRLSVTLFIVFLLQNHSL